MRDIEHSQSVRIFDPSQFNTAPGPNNDVGVPVTVDIANIQLGNRLCLLIAIQTRGSQRPRRNYAQFILGLNTGLRVEELNGLDFSQYQGKHLQNVHRTFFGGRPQPRDVGIG